MTDETPTPTPPEKRVAIDTLRQMLDPAVPVIFRAHLEPKHEFYLVTAHYLGADISTLVSLATGLPLQDGEFRASIKVIIDTLVSEGVDVTNIRIVDADDVVED